MNHILYKLVAVFIFMTAAIFPVKGDDLVILEGSANYNASRVNAILKNDRSALGIGIGLLSALNRAVPEKLFTGNSVKAKGVAVPFASSGGPIRHLRNQHQMVLENISVIGRKVSFDLTVHTDEMIGHSSYRMTKTLAKSGLNFFKKYQGKTVVIEV